MGLAIGFDRHDRRLALNFAGMMLRDRFLGTALGLVWAILQPAMLIAVFVFVFTFIFRSRLGVEGETELTYIIWLVSGYGPWLAINEGLLGGANSVTGQTSLVKNMAFKNELLPVAASSLGLVPLFVSIAILAGLIYLDGGAPHETWLIMIPVLIFQFLFVAGVGLMLGAANVFVRDISFALPSLLTMLLFLSPIFYPISLFPDYLRGIVVWNPIYVLANCYRVPILEQQIPPLWQLVYLGVISIIVFILGLNVFRRMKTYFHSRL